MVKRPDGLLEFLDEDLRLKTLAAGEVVNVQWSKMRNGRFFRKWWVLAKFAFDIWRARGSETAEHNGVKVNRSFNVFRRDLIVMSGYFEPVFRADGKMKLEPMSIAWANMDEETFAKLYDATIDTILNKVLPNAGLSRESIEDAVNELLRFV
jgi:hypothetical protein